MEIVENVEFVRAESLAEFDSHDLVIVTAGGSEAL